MEYSKAGPPQKVGKVHEAAVSLRTTGLGRGLFPLEVCRKLEASASLFHYTGKSFIAAMAAAGDAGAASQHCARFMSSQRHPKFQTGHCWKVRPNHMQAASGPPTFIPAATAHGGSRMHLPGTPNGLQTILGDSICSWRTERSLCCLSLKPRLLGHFQIKAEGAV